LSTQTGFSVAQLVFGIATPSLALGADGLPIVAFVDSPSLAVVHCEDIECSSLSTSIVDTPFGGVQVPSLAVGSDGLPLISYYHATAADLRVAHCNDVRCTDATTSILDSAGDVGLQSSIAIGSDGLGLIAYKSQSALKVAHCSDGPCTAATISTLESGFSIVDISLTIGADGLGLIAYTAVGLGLRVAHCADVLCSSATVTVLEPATYLGSQPAVAVGADGLALISYEIPFVGGLRVAHCADAVCTSSTKSTLDGLGGLASSITVGLDGIALVSHYAETGALTRAVRVVRCADVVCSAAASTSVVEEASFGVGGMQTEIIIGSDQLPLVVYGIIPQQSIRVAHCSNAACTPHVRPR
jgi:hypothetical protein